MFSISEKNYTAIIFPIEITSELYVDFFALIYTSIQDVKLNIVYKKSALKSLNVRLLLQHLGSTQWPVTLPSLRAVAFFLGSNFVRHIGC